MRDWLKIQASGDKAKYQGPPARGKGFQLNILLYPHNGIVFAQVQSNVDLFIILLPACGSEYWYARCARQGAQQPWRGD